MKNKLLTVLLYSLVMVIASSELLANKLSISPDIKNWAPYIDRSISLDKFGRSVQGNSINSTALAINLNLNDGHLSSSVITIPNLNKMEPVTMLLLGIGMIGLASFGKRKFKKY